MSLKFRLVTNITELEGRWFDPSWCYLEFFIDIKILPIALWPWGRLSL